MKGMRHIARLAVTRAAATALRPGVTAQLHGRGPPRAADAGLRGTGQLQSVVEPLALAAVVLGSPLLAQGLESRPGGGGALGDEVAADDPAAAERQAELQEAPACAALTVFSATAGLTKESEEPLAEQAAFAVHIDGFNQAM